MSEVALSETKTSSAGEFLRRRMGDLAPFVTLVALFVFFSVATDSFLNVINLRNILAQVSTLAVVATGVTFVLLCGEIDLSVASVGMMTGVVAASLFGKGLRLGDGVLVAASSLWCVRRCSRWSSASSTTLAPRE
jgi:ribose/xylose/arabinose/galactoside ABC-type transport system permease subunit